MSTKTKIKSSPRVFRYTPEDLASRNAAEDENAADRFIDRNQAAINVHLKAARASIKKGKGKTYASSDKLVADVIGKRRRATKT